MKTPNIKWRVLFVALAPALLICTTLSLYFIALRYQEVELSLQARGASMARQLASAAEYGAFSGNRTELLRLADAAIREQDVISVSFYGRNNETLVRLVSSASTFSTPKTKYATPSPFLTFREGILHGVSAFDDPFQTSPKPTAQRETETLGFVQVEMSRDRADKEKRDILGITLLFSIAALAIGILLSYRLGRDVTEPILALQKTVSRIHQGDLQARVALHPSETLRTLEEGVNEMAASLQAGREYLEQRIAESTQELRLQKDEAERTSQAKSRFLAAASHDLRQPLHALTLFTEGLEPKVNDAQQRRMVEQIRSAVSVLNEQLNTLLDISRIDLGDTRLALSTVELQPLIERVVALHAPEAAAKELRLRHASTHMCVKSDPKLLERMLGNLVSNAIRYTEYGGILIGVRRRGERVCLEVWDTGMGISPDQIPLIFQEFYQIRNPERDAQKGLGLGLSIVTRLGHLLDHPIRVRSKPGRGTVFSIDMPRMAEETLSSLPKEPDSRAGTADAAKSAGGSLLGKILFDFDADIVLLVDSEPDCSALEGYLSGWGARPLCVDQAQRYALMLQEGAPLADVVIFTKDHLMAACSLAASHIPAAHFILLADPDDPQPPESLLSCTRINRPLRPARLRALLQQLLQGSLNDRHKEES